MRFVVLLPLLAVAGCAAFIDRPTPYTSSECDTTPMLGAQISVTTSPAGSVTHVIIDASRQTGWVEDTGKNGMTRCARTPISGETMSVVVAGAPSTRLTPSSQPGRYEGDVAGYGTDFAVTLQERSGAQITVHVRTPEQFPIRLEDTSKGVLVHWTESTDPKLGDAVDVMLPDGHIQLWDRSGYPNQRDSELVPTSVFTQHGTYRIIVTRISNDASITAVEFVVERAVQ